MRFWLLLITIAVAMAAALPARADVPMTGTFVASSACPALQSIRKATNPGNLTLTPQQAYRLVAANAARATHYLLILPGAFPERRWVAIGCGTVQAPGATAPTLQPSTVPTVAATAPNSPTHFVLSLSWEPGFCAGMTGKPECAAETPAGFDASHFTLHGLWPDPNEYCGAAPADIASDKASHWNALPPVSLSATTRTRLDRAMPGTQSLLERHEWLKHGTCAGVGMEAYFARAITFLDAVNASPVQALFASHVGQSLTLPAIRAAFEAGFGPGAGERIRLACSHDRRITEITIGLDGDVMGSASLPALVAAARPTNGGCDSGTVTALR